MIGSSVIKEKKLVTLAAIIPAVNIPSHPMREAATEEMTGLTGMKVVIARTATIGSPGASQITKTSIGIMGVTNPGTERATVIPPSPNDTMRNRSLTVTPPKDERVDQESTKRRRIGRNMKTRKKTIRIQNLKKHQPTKLKQTLYRLFLQTLQKLHTPVVI